ncbi:MAG: hypothetical protein JWP57_2060 [Spirosoma sp.]|nr:hypothetical protein [Spirosoma sp.]
MTDKEVARFKVKFPKINLSKARLDAYKLNLADDADDAAIDARLDEVNGTFPFEEIAKADDRLRQPPKPAPAPAPPAPAPDPAPVPDDTPEWAKGLIESNKTLLQEVSNLKAGKTAETRKQQLETALTGANDAFKNPILKAFARMQFATDEEFSTYLAEVKTDSEAFTQGLADTSLSQNGAPRQPAGGSTAKPTQAQIDATLDALMPK